MVRLPFAIAIACLVTFGLFWTMQALVGVSGELKEASSSPTIRPFAASQVSVRPSRHAMLARMQLVLEM